MLIDEGVLYFSTGIGAPTVISGGIEELLSSTWLRQAGCVYVLGLASNAELITKLWLNKLHQSAPRELKIANPALCIKHGDDQATVLFRMSDLSYAPSVGGWHEANATDFQTFELIYRRQQGKSLKQDSGLQLLQAHPAYPAFSFVRGCRDADAEALISKIIDPRYAKDPEDPEKTVTLRREFGLKDCNLLGALEEILNKKDWKHDHPVMPVLRCLLPGWEDGLMEGCNFFHRIACNFPFGLPSQSVFEDPDDGTLKKVAVSCSAFLRFVCEVWIARGYPRVPGPQAASGALSLFVPEYFFNDPIAADEWRAHLLE